ATAGMGDVLTGVIASLIAQGLEPERAAVAGVYLHGRAGDRVAERLGNRGLLASDVIDEMPQSLKEIV
ncbi:MAG TPA: NAD(P)H-hydrate dehydratase, partial [bacterium]|nr:NAD(P)H-hydrate dehydratase [bacterium]